jgi:phosphopantothenoylcysteine synthetase/decarboxylase
MLPVPQYETLTHLIDIAQSTPKQPEVDIPSIVDQLTAKLTSYAQEYHNSTDTEIVEAIYASHHNEGSSNLKVYDGILSQVTAGSSDSETQACRAGAIPEDPQELVQGTTGLQEEDDDDDDDEAEDEDEEEEVKDKGEGEDQDEDQDEDDDEDEDEDDDADNRANASAPRTSGIDINISDSEDSDSESDGEGGSGARLLVSTQLDGDISMRTTILNSDDSSGSGSN